MLEPASVTRLLMLTPTADKSTRFDFAALLNSDQRDPATLREWLLDARRRTRALTDDLEGACALGPRLPIVNPPLWELAHIAWFQEYWCLRFRNGANPSASLIENADPLYNSAIAAHDTRWDLPLLPWPQMLGYQDAVLERVLERIARGSLDEELRYFLLLSIFHEDMHGEALFYTRQTLGYSRPPLELGAELRPIALARGDVTYAGGKLLLGASRGSGFAFDNECSAHEVIVAPFTLAAVPVTNAEYATFVEEDGYARDELWSDSGRGWRESGKVQGPLYWRKQDGQWWIREFDEWISLSQREHRPVIFVNAHEAQAYCRWAGRRLPREVEWEFAAKVGGESSNGTATHADHANGKGQVWEWTADAFEPYPGFVPGPYAEYSAPWFGNHRVLRGGCYVTRRRLLRATYRNFYTPDRRDVLAGFCTCALESE